MWDGTYTQMGKLTGKLPFDPTLSKMMTTDKQTVVIVIVVFSFRCLSVDVGYV